MNIYLLHGGNSFARKHAKKNLIDHLRESGASLTAFHVPPGADEKNPVFDALRLKLSGSSLFGGNEIVAASFLAQDKPARGRSRQDGGIKTDPILPWLKLAPSNINLIIEIAAELPKSSPLLKAVEKLHGETQLFKMPPQKSRDALVQAARAYLAQEKLAIDPYLLTRLIEAGQGDWWFVFTALEQAVLLSQGGKMRPDDLLKIWNLSEDQNIFKLFDAIGSGNKAGALTLLFENNIQKGKQSLQEVERALGLISLMARQLRQLIAVKSLRDSAGLQKDWQIPFFALPKLKQQAACFSLEFLTQAFEKLAELQEKAKRGLYSPLPLLDFYVLYLISHRKSL